MSPVDDATLRGLALLGSVVLCGGAWLIRPPTARIATGALAAILWLLPSLLLANILAGQVNAWQFRSNGHQLLGIPVDLWFAYTLLWGPFCVVVFSRSIALATAVMTWAQLIIAPELSPVRIPGPYWLVGEVAVIVTCLVPALVFARLTSQDRCAPARGAFHFIADCAFLFWVVPAGIMANVGRDYATEMLTLDRTAVCLLPLALGLLCLSAAAIYEFAVRGDGTPIPFDPPKHLVTTGPYAYIANPMQVTIVGMLILLSIHLNAIAIAGAALSVLVFFLSFVPWHHRNDIAQRFGKDWHAWRARTPNWFPRLTRAR